MGNKLISPCVPRVDNRIAAYNFDHPDIIPSKNKDLVTIEGQLTYLEADKIVCDNEPCCICMDNLSCVSLDCGHTNFCWECIRELSLNGYRECPLCRTEISKINVCYNLEFKVFK
jgi:hypothetical protein